MPYPLSEEDIFQVLLRNQRFLLNSLQISNNRRRMEMPFSVKQEGHILSGDPMDSFADSTELLLWCFQSRRSSEAPQSPSWAQTQTERQEISASCSFASHLNLCKNKVRRSDILIDTVFFLCYQEHTKPCPCAANPFLTLETSLFQNCGYSRISSRSVLTR